MVMNAPRRWSYVLLTTALLAATSAPAQAGAASQPPPPTSVVTAVAADLAPSAPAGSVQPPPPGCGATDGVAYNLTPQIVPDANGVLPGIVLSKIHFSTAGSYSWQVVVSAAITHPVSSDLDLSLISPHGTEVTLSSGN